MKKWKIIKIITSAILILFIIYLILDAIYCINMEYPHPMIGIDAHNWIDQFILDLIVILLSFGIPLRIDIAILIVSILKVKKLENKK